MAGPLLAHRLPTTRLTVIACAVAVATAAAAETGESGLPLPRFVSLDAAEVNARAGPGLNYPVNWVFLRRSMPIEVTAEFDEWRLVRDIAGAQGWIHRNLLSGRRSVVVIDGEQPVLAEPEADSRLVARAEDGAQGYLLSCAGAWCRVQFGRIKGWIARARLWGVYPDEDVR